MRYYSLKLLSWRLFNGDENKMPWFLGPAANKSLIIFGADHITPAVIDDAFLDSYQLYMFDLYRKIWNKTIQQESTMRIPAMGVLPNFNSVLQTLPVNTLNKVNTTVVKPFKHKYAFVVYGSHFATMAHDLKTKVIDYLGKDYMYNESRVVCNEHAILQVRGKDNFYSLRPKAERDLPHEERKKYV